MGRQFDELLGNKARELFLNREESYEKGAWEKFLERKKRGKKRLAFWLSTGVAASIIIVVSFGLLYQPWVSKPETAILKKEQEKKLKGNLKQHNQETTSGHKQKAHAPFTVEPDETYSDEEEKSKWVPMLANERSKLEKIGLKPLKALLFERSDSLYLNGVPVKGSSDHSAVVADESDKNNLLIGVVLASGLGVGNTNLGLSNSMNYNGGISIELPVANRFSFGSGFFLNYMGIDRKATSFSGDLDNPDKIENQFRTEQVSMGFPVQLVYSINNRKENLFVIIGSHSYYSLKQTININSKTTREVRVFSGGGDPLIFTETFESSEIIQGPKNQLFPFATIDFTVSYRIFQNGGISYEVRPFYSHPITSLTKEGTEVPFGGIAIRLLFNSSHK